MPKITDMQSRLLAHAARRENGSFFPLPDAMTHPPTVRRSIAALIGRGWAKSRATMDDDAVAHMENDVHYGVFITAAGCAAIGVEEHRAEITEPSRAPDRTTKAAMILALLLREQGATLAELTEATGWLPHTTRAALTGLRKKEHALEKSKRDGTTSYRIVAA
jgi:predicted Zn-ribbon and HTH transcriptional regulator